MAIDWTDIYKKYKGLWVALKDWNKPQVIAYGKTLQETMRKAQKKGFHQPLVTQIPHQVLPIVGIS